MHYVNRGKLDITAQKWIFLGYSSIQKGYKYLLELMCHFLKPSHFLYERCCTYKPLLGNTHGGAVAIFFRWDPLLQWGVSCKKLSYTCSFIVFRSHLRGRKKQEDSSFQHLNAQEFDVVQNLTFSDLLQQENSFQNKFVQDEQISNINPAQNWNKSG